MTKHVITLALAGIVVQGCAMQPPPPAVGGPNYDEGIAKSCTATPVDAAGAATITMTNDGWCAVRTTEKDGKPYALSFLKTRPSHGTAYLQNLGGVTRMEYTPNGRYTGADRFIVGLKSRTPNAPETVVQVTVNVTMGANMAPPPAPTPAPAPARRTPAPAPAPARR